LPEVEVTSLPESAPEPPPVIYHVVVAPADARVFSCRGQCELLSTLREISKSDDADYTRVLIFVGDRLYLSRGPHKHVLFHDGAVPLLEPPANLEPDTEGYLIDRPAPPAPETMELGLESDEDLDTDDF
jgi:hypothetical protein